MRSVAARLLRRMTGSSPRQLLAEMLPPNTGGLPPARLDDFGQRRVLVLAPHPDDEAIGCGGVLIRHAQAGASITLVYVTDGGAGASPGSTERAARVAVREAEARAYAAALGAGVQLVFLGAPDGALQPDDALAARLEAVVREAAPQLIYLPHPMDTHEDHWQTNRLAAGPFAQPALRDVAVRGYEVWSPLPANGVADVSHVAARKFELLGLYGSQLAQTDYVHAIRGLNAYRCMALPTRSGYAEAFHATVAGRYAALVRRMELR